MENVGGLHIKYTNRRRASFEANTKYDFSVVVVCSSARTDLSPQCIYIYMCQSKYVGCVCHWRWPRAPDSCFAGHHDECIVYYLHYITVWYFIHMAAISQVECFQYSTTNTDITTEQISKTQTFTRIVVVVVDVEHGTRSALATMIVFYTLFSWRFLFAL